VIVSLFVLAALSAAGDWFAVARRLYRLEYILKPLTMAFLVAAAISANLYFIHGWVIAAVVFGLLGDVGLMLSKGRTDLPFILGLGSFLVGHVCYIAAFVRLHLDGLHVIAGLLVVFGAALISLPAVLGGARRLGGTELATVVALYAGALSAMTVLAVGTGLLLTALGGVLFLASDSLIAWERFATPVPRGRLLIIVSYHLAQGLILIGLIRAF
jgi:uncharacterized membrane protein YhhN